MLCLQNLEILKKTLTLIKLQHMADIEEIISKDKNFLSKVDNLQQ